MLGELVYYPSIIINPIAKPMDKGLDNTDPDNSDDFMFISKHTLTPLPLT
jgi:hypothetical protein